MAARPATAGAVLAAQRRPGHSSSRVSVGVASVSVSPRAVANRPAPAPAPAPAAPGPGRVWGATLVSGLCGGGSVRVRRSRSPARPLSGAAVVCAPAKGRWPARDVHATLGEQSRPDAVGSWQRRLTRAPRSGGAREGSAWWKQDEVCSLPKQTDVDVFAGALAKLGINHVFHAIARRLLVLS